MTVNGTRQLIATIYKEKNQDNCGEDNEEFTAINVPLSPKWAKWACLSIKLDKQVHVRTPVTHQWKQSHKQDITDIQPTLFKKLSTSSHVAVTVQDTLFSKCM